MKSKVPSPSAEKSTGGNRAPNASGSRMQHHVPLHTDHTRSNSHSRTGGASTPKPRGGSGGMKGMC